MSEPFRDDHEAAIERADALEHELDETKRERDALKTEVEQLRQARESASERKRDRKQRRKALKRAVKEKLAAGEQPRSPWLAFGILVVAVGIVVFAGMGVIADLVMLTFVGIVVAALVKKPPASS